MDLWRKKQVVLPSNGLLAKSTKRKPFVMRLGTQALKQALEAEFERLDTQWVLMRQGKTLQEKEGNDSFQDILYRLWHLGTGRSRRFIILSIRLTISLNDIVNFEEPIELLSRFHSIFKHDQ